MNTPLPRRFDGLVPFAEPRSARWAKRALLLFILVHIPIGAMSGYRAVVQIHSMSLSVSSSPLTAGSQVRADLGSWGRTFVDYDIELQQGTRIDTLGHRFVAKHHNPTYDQSIRRDSLIVALTEAMLAPFADGPAVLRARAVGRPQWLRTPPATVREAAVSIRRAAR